MMLLVNASLSPIKTNGKLLQVSPQLYLPKPYFWLRPGENLLLDSTLGVRRWVDEIKSLFFNNQFNKNIPVGQSTYGNYPILDKPFVSTALSRSFDSALNSNEFTNIIISKFINKTWTGSAQQYSIPIINRSTNTEPSGKITTRGWNIYCINSAIGMNNFTWEFWTAKGYESNGFDIVKGDLCQLNQWEVITCRRDATTTAIFQDGNLKQSKACTYFPSSNANWQFAGNETLTNLYFNYALTDASIFHWSRYLKMLFSELF